MLQTESPIYLRKSGILFIFLPLGLCRKSLICIPLWWWYCVGLHSFHRSSLQDHLLSLAVQCLLQFIPQGPLLWNIISHSHFPFISNSLTHLLSSWILLKFLTVFFWFMSRVEFSTPLAAHWGQKENVLWFRGVLDYQLNFHDHLSSLLQSSTWVLCYRKHHSREAGWLRRLRVEGYNHIFICQSEKGNPGAKLAQNNPHYSDCKGGKPEEFCI